MKHMRFPVHVRPLLWALAMPLLFAFALLGGWPSIPVVKATAAYQGTILAPTNDNFANATVLSIL